MNEIISKGWAEVKAGFRYFNFCFEFAREEIVDQHRLTTLGPLWFTLTYLLYSGAFILIFEREFGGINYAAYVALGFYVWFIIAESMARSLRLLRKSAPYINGTTIPVFVFVMQFTTQSTIRLLYSGLGCIFVLILASYTLPTFQNSVYAALGMFLVIATIPAIATIMAISCVYFPDLEFIVSNIMRVGLFLTPTFWLNSEKEGIRNWLYQYNPFTHYLQIVRGPLLGDDAILTSWIVCFVLTCLCWLLMFVLLGYFRKKIIFML